MTTAFAIITVLLYLRIRYLKGYIYGQSLAHKYLKQTISDQADLVEQKDHIIGYMSEVIQAQNEMILESQIDGQEIVDEILRENDNNKNL